MTRVIMETSDESADSLPCAQDQDKGQDGGRGQEGGQQDEYAGHFVDQPGRPKV